ncbi:MAG: glycine hydroxymethyltransferase [Planctomycetes bacterium]|nr:glycine hydroxymethyltransferase [Planctomycetota bacterium]
MSAISKYLSKTGTDKVNAGMLAYTASLEQVAKVAPGVASSVVNELADQRSSLKLIASENYCSLSTQLAMGNLLTDKYAEGFPEHRFYAGCANVDTIESLACKKACEVFGAEHAYVQPHSGADANMIAFWAIINTMVEIPELEKIGDTNLSHMDEAKWEELRTLLGNQKLLGMDYYSGGHLTHGYRYNVSARMFKAYNYSVSKETGLLDYDALEKQAMEIKPLILLAGYSAYPRKINFRRMREIADKAGAILMVDMAHFAGLVAGKVFEGDFEPVPHAHVVTTTTHKTLRGPRGGMVLCKKEFAEAVDKGCPLVIGGPLPHVIAAKAVAFTEAASDDFKAYAKNIVDNSATLAKACADEGLTIATGGTDNHLFLIDVRPQGLTGRQAESVMRECGITLNRNSLPFDPNGPWYTSGLRIGTPAITTLGMDTAAMKEIASIITLVLKNTKAALIAKGDKAGQPGKAKYEINESVVKEARARVQALLDKFVLYPELDLEFLKEEFCK